MSIKISYEKDFYTNFTEFSNEESLVKNNSLDFQKIEVNLSKTLLNLKKEFDLQMNNLITIEKKNNQFNSISKFSEVSVIKLDDSENPGRKESEEKKNFMVALLNLTPKNVMNLQNAKNNFEKCLN